MYTTEVEIEHIERRRSGRIIALEEKKHEKKDRKLVLALAANHHSRNVDKGKTKIDVDDHLHDSTDDEEEHGPPKKGRKRRGLQQLISSTTEGEHPQSGGTSRKNVSSLNSIPEKQVLERIIDTLQRKDPEELFAEPVNPDVMEGYYQIVKQPMDFGTMRAKLHEDMYTNLEEFKRDVYLICTNAMLANPASSRQHKVAEVINSHARRVFEGLRADPEQFDLTFSLNKRRRQPRTSRPARVPPKPAGRKKATHSTVPERRDMYWPTSNKTLVSEFVNANKFNIQLNNNASNYRDSLLQFVKGLGPTPQRIAAKKLEALNLNDNVSGTEIITPNNADRLSLALNIPGVTAAQENSNSNTISGGFDLNINVEAHQGNYNTSVDNSWNAKAAAILANIFINNDKGKRPSGIGSSNARGTMDIWGPNSKGKMVQEGTSHMHELQLGANPNGKDGQWKTYARIPKRLATESCRSVVWPTKVIKPKPLEAKYVNRHSGLSFIPQPSQEDSMPNTKLSLVPHGPGSPAFTVPHQPRSTNSVSMIDSGLSLASRSRPEVSMSVVKPTINLTGQSSLPQPRPEHSMFGTNYSSLSLMPQLMLGESSNPRNNISGQSILPSQASHFSNWNVLDTSLAGLGTPYQPGDFQDIMGSSSSTIFNNTPYSVLQKSHEQVLQQTASSSSYTPSSATSFYDLQMNPPNQWSPLGLFPMNEPETSLDLGMPSGSAVNYYGGEGDALIEQPEDVTLPLLWDNDQEDNLSLQL